ncbi:hypothetical protein ACOME3_008809 [Neoechinorhynchus agilis]
MRVECQDVKFKESRNLCTTHDILHNLPIKQSLRKMICSATIVQENNSVDHDSFDEDFENAEPIPNTTDDDQEDIADENSLEDLHSDSSNDWSGMDNYDDQTHRTIHQVISITLLSLKLQPLSIAVQKTLATIPMEL